jgi:hypothetical protein
MLVALAGEALMPAYTNATTIVPPLFQEIMRNDREITDWKGRKVIVMDIAKRTLKRKRELMAAAEKALKWNVDKGNKAR